MSIFFTDRDLGNQFPDVLAEAGIAVEPHDKHFDAKTTDEKWLDEVGNRGWFALTHDRQIRYKPNERDAVMTAGLGLFVLVGKVPHRELAENFVASVAAVERFISRNPRPFIAKVKRPSPSTARGGRAGSVGMWLSESEWRKDSKRR